MDLDFARIECEIITDTPAQLAAALYDAVRNFEVLFKTSSCVTMLEECASCSECIDCPYRIVFDQKLSPDPEIVRLHQKPSLPFSLYIKENGPEYTSHVVGIVVAGSAVNYIELFDVVLTRMAKTAVNSVLAASAFIMRSYCLDYHGGRHEFGQTAEGLTANIILLSGQHILLNTVHSDSAKLLLKSPLRLLSNGSVARRFDFGTFFRSQMRRCSSLFAYYGHGELMLDYAQLSEVANTVAVFDNGIHYTQPPWSQRPNRAGLMGSAECAGLVEPMLALLQLGSCFNAGKGAAFGYGFHQLEVI